LYLQTQELNWTLVAAIRVWPLKFNLPTNRQSDALLRRRLMRGVLVFRAVFLRMMVPAMML
jgi:hypothetical protein